MKRFIIESLSDSFQNDLIKTKKFSQINNEDFSLRFDFIDDYVILLWIYNKSKKYSGREIFYQFIKYINSLGIREIYAYAAKGIDHIRDGKKSIKINDTGYFNLLKWGFIPTEGINFINKTLKSNYKSFEEMFSDNEFFSIWKEKGKEFPCVFDTDKNSISMKQFLKAK